MCFSNTWPNGYYSYWAQLFEMTNSVFVLVLYKSTGFSGGSPDCNLEMKKNPCFQPRSFGNIKVWTNQCPALPCVVGFLGVNIIKSDGSVHWLSWVLLNWQTTRTSWEPLKMRFKKKQLTYSVLCCDPSVYIQVFNKLFEVFDVLTTIPIVNRNEI